METTSQRTAANYSAEFAAKAVNVMKFVRAKSFLDVQDEEIFYGKLVERLNRVLVGGYHKHFEDIVMQKTVQNHAYHLVGMTFLHLDCNIGSVHIITPVSRSNSKWYHNIVTGYMVDRDELWSTKPHGWTENGYNEIFQKDFVNLYWSYNGRKELKHSYLECPSVHGLYVSSDVGKMIIAMDQVLDIGDLSYTNEVVKGGVGKCTIVSSY